METPEPSGNELSKAEVQIPFVLKDAVNNALCQMPVDTLPALKPADLPGFSVCEERSKSGCSGR